MKVVIRQSLSQPVNIKPETRKDAAYLIAAAICVGWALGSVAAALARWRRGLSRTTASSPISSPNQASPAQEPVS